MTASTGRIAATVGPRTRRIVYGCPTPEQVADELRAITVIDRAHLVMLAERKLIAADEAAALLRHIDRLRADGFGPLLELDTPRGLYLAYEEHLIAVLGIDVGGRLHTGRSRNDLKATITAMQARTELHALLAELIRLQSVLLGRARAHRDVVMPVHTHFQAALPVTFGYYLTGLALAIGRDIRAVRQAADELRRCPMGSGAAAGSALPIDPARVAALLGFDEPARHALDAVASRDVALRALAAAAGAALTVSRLAADLQLWSTAEFGFVVFPDRLVGGSSAMPQKRNAFLLEHLKAKAGVVVGAYTAAAAITRGTPFTNSIEVGTEAVAATWPGLRAALDCAELAQSIVLGARPVPPRMLAGAEHGFVGATALANRLVADGVPFRAAHHLVGDAVRRATGRGATRLSEQDLPAGLAGTGHSMAALVADQRYGGGPGDFDGGFTAAYEDLAEHTRWYATARDRQRTAGRELTAAVSGIVERAGRR
ncbi:argininosuccinate lyase [Dactylosporangium matsuzakiense]|uniref:Argininosuccinate lyase n=1 Tax=Dactylosporangium matsuzakiense TaxID=53360 RepID=A0A9W6NQG8_9ACTN|nr:argininosuccinate lyase [Dactylosporangium matsuzakiense]UWZ42304.1 argininosuccinate lyase [Dactylosporangium matsuzakiense]GLL05323.1 argininosuccinate lyase [Dactylosporangium matsuzakiense]